MLNKEIIKIILEGNIDKLKEKIDQFEINDIDNDGRTMFLISIMKGKNKTEIAKYLIEKGVDTFKEDLQQSDSLKICCEKMLFEIVLILISKKHFVKKINLKSIFEIEKNKKLGYKMSMILLDNGLSISTSKFLFHEILKSDYSHHEEEFMNFLFDKGVDINGSNLQYDHLIVYLINNRFINESKRLNMLDVLSSNGYNFNLENLDELGNDILLFSLYQHKYEIANKLIQKRKIINLNVENKYGVN
jgi:hypothetical protein